MCSYWKQKAIKKVLKKADVVLAVSNALKDEIIATDVEGIAEKTKIHYNSVDINKFKEEPEEKINESKFKKDFFNEFNIDSNKPTILFVGNIVKAKNITSTAVTSIFFISFNVFIHTTYLFYFL